MLRLLFRRQLLSDSATPWTAACQASPSFITQWEKKNLFNKGSWESWISTYKRIELDSPYTTHKNQLNMDKRVKSKAWNYKTPKRKHYGKASQHQSWQWFLGYDTQSTGNKSKNKQVVRFQTINNRVKR